MARTPQEKRLAEQLTIAQGVAQQAQAQAINLEIALATQRDQAESQVRIAQEEAAVAGEATAEKTAELEGVLTELDTSYEGLPPALKGELHSRYPDRYPMP